MQPIATSGSSPHRRSALVSFRRLRPDAFTLDAEFVNQPGAIAALTTSLERRGIYVVWLEFGLHDPDEEIVRLKVKGCGPPESVNQTRAVVDAGATFDGIESFVASSGTPGTPGTPATPGPPASFVPFSEQRRLGIEVLCLDREYLTADLTRLIARHQGDVVRLTVKTLNSSPRVPDCGQPGYLFEGEVRTATLAQQNRIVFDLIQLHEAWRSQDPTLQILLTDLRLGVKLGGKLGS